MLLSLIFVFSIHAEQDDFQVLKGPYLGQKPPGITPEIFASGIISNSQDLYSCPVFSKDGKMVFWRIMNSGENNGVYFTKVIENTWTTPQKAPFMETNKGVNNDVPYFSLNGEILYFLSDRPVGDIEPKMRVWHTMKENGVWKKPILFEKINPKEIMLHWQFSISENGIFI